MTNIRIYDTEANTLESMAEKYDVTVASLVESLMDYLPDVEEDLKANAREAEAMDRAKQMLENASLDSIAELMDDEIRDRLHQMYAPCNDAFFLKKYIIKHKAKYGEAFTI
jgi:hypothetical protein